LTVPSRPRFAARSSRRRGASWRRSSLNVPDGLAFALDGTLYISCYEPRRIYPLKPGGKLETLIEDPAATAIAHPTNIALKGSKMYTSNLGRWHITEVDLT
jgi:sugar lactone lactonase YvrE